MAITVSRCYPSSHPKTDKWYPKARSKTPTFCVHFSFLINNFLFLIYAILTLHFASNSTLHSQHSNSENFQKISKSNMTLVPDSQHLTVAGSEWHSLWLLHFLLYTSYHISFISNNISHHISLSNTKSEEPKENFRLSTHLEKKISPSTINLAFLLI